MATNSDHSFLYRLIGDKVRSSRRRAERSQAWLASKLSMTRTSIVNIEAGRQRPPVHVLWNIAENLGVEVAMLLPTQLEAGRESVPLSLDGDAIAKIEEAASGNAQLRRQLASFVGRARQERRGS